MSIVSQNIKYLRRLNGLTQDQFSRKIGIKRSLVGAYEEARANPPLDKLKVIANCFGISVDALIKQDIRKLRQTPDMSFTFNEKKEMDAIPIRDVAAEFLNKIQPISEIPTPKPSVFPSEETPQIPQIETIKKVSTSAPYFPPTTSYNEPYNIPKIREIGAIVTHYVPINQHFSYVNNFDNINFINQLATIVLPFEVSNLVRAFEIKEDFPIKNAVIFGELVQNWDEIKEATSYILITKSYGIIYRRVYNQLKLKGTLLLSSDIHTIPSKEITGAEVNEIWEVKGYLTMSLPQPPVSFGKLEQLIDELKYEIERVKRK